MEQGLTMFKGKFLVMMWDVIFVHSKVNIAFEKFSQL